MLRLEGISRSFNGIPALRGVSVDIPPGQITIFAGADGAGKSTLFKILVGLMKRDGGDIYLGGENIGHDTRRITDISGYMPEGFSLYQDLGVEENLDFFADIHRVPRGEREIRKRALLEKTGMWEFRHRRARALSGGMKQKLSLASILLAAPRLIILDEPTTGVDPLSRLEFFNIIRDLKDEGKTIIASTPYLDEAERGDYIVFLKDGRVIKQDAIDRLRGNFPAELYSILPRDNIFDTMKAVENIPGLKGNLYIRGKTIKYLRSGGENLAHRIPHVSVRRETPRLEDIYLYYERGGAG